MMKRDQNLKLMQFLMGLNEIFNNARGNILMMEPIHVVNKAYSLVIQDEKQMGFQNLPVFQSDSASFSVGSNSKPKHSFNNPRTNFNTQPQKYCKKNVHLIEKCYKLHGYPQNFKFGNRNARVATNVYSNPESKVDNFSENPTSSTTITADQYKQLRNILQQVQVVDEGQNQYPSASASFADSGTTDHMTSDKSLLTNIANLPILILVTLPNGYKVKVTSIGTVHTNSLVTLSKVLYLPTFKYNLISVYKLILDTSLLLTFSLIACFLQGPSLKKPFVHVVPKPLRDKFSPRSTPCIFLGYPPGKKAYKLLQLSDRKILISRDVVFHENIFPYFESTSPTTLFPDVFSSSNFDYPTSCIPGPTNSSRQHTSPSSQNISTPSPSSVTSLSPPVSIPISDIFAPSQVTAPEVPLRYPSRRHHQPSYLKDYVCVSASSRFPLTLTYVPTSLKSVCFSSLSSTNQALHPTWKEAMLKEFEALKANATWNIVPLPPGKKPIGNK
ncbi:uncharacterized protein LOC142162278 [Nicotiana tabacum]|uniref:Uncharacterized protein LOC142162278 n=1 Tax=Nicotiana tabacum TaxID=4097 RepID=A0AC58RPP8_TOBAC